MYVTQKKTNIKTVRQGDPLWTLNDGLVVSPRAGFEISQGCPKEYRMIIQECIGYGWLKPVAHIYGKEYTMDALR